MVELTKATTIQSPNFSSSDFLIELAAENNTGRLLERILQQSQRLTCADGGTIYLLNNSPNGQELSFALLINKSLGIHQNSFAEQKIDLANIPLYAKNGKENHNNVVSHAALTKKVFRIDDAYSIDEFDFSGTRKFDRQSNYHSQSFLTVPLLNHEQDLIGVLQLLNAMDENGQVVPFSDETMSLVTGLAGYAAIALDNHLLVKELKNLLEAFIQCIAQAIDAKSSHTSAHCQRIPLLMELIAQAACEDQNVFKDFSLTEDEWYELKVASWLHDCGKLATPDTVLDKSTKLHLMLDGIETIKTRFAAASLAAEKQALLGQLNDPNNLDAIESARILTMQSLNDDLAFIVKSNKGGESMTNEDKQRLQGIANKGWIDSNGSTQALLTEQELAYLLIERGTLTRHERELINSHISVTIDMLESLPFPRKLQRVSEYAGGHHEKMDGTGFPKGLTQDQMSIPARMMAIADIFEALTSKERPYKSPMKISQAIKIMQDMKENNHIDAKLFDLFTHSRAWEKYAQQELLPEQLDI
ncbi:GAF and HD-GYP domain-containing protein [Pseudomonadota bacterium]